MMGAMVAMEAREAASGAVMEAMVEAMAAVTWARAAAGVQGEEQEAGAKAEVSSGEDRGVAPGPPGAGAEAGEAEVGR